MTKFINVADIVEDNGLTVRQNNLNSTHKFETGTVVYLEEKGRWARIVECGRDCDGTPLYWVGPEAAWQQLDNYPTLIKDIRWRLVNWIEGGYSEESFRAFNSYAEGFKKLYFSEV